MRQQQRTNNGAPLSAAGSGGLYRIHVIDRAARIMECFTFENPELSVAEIGAVTELHKSTAHRILMALEHNGFIEQNPQNGKYHLGLKLFNLGQRAVSRLNLREVARRFLQQLMEKSRETVHLGILDDGEVLYIEKVEGPHALRMPSRIGRHIRIHCTSLGKAMLSCMEENEVRRILQKQPLAVRTANTIRTVKQLLADLEETKRRGYAIDDEEGEIGLRCVGSPIFDYSGKVIGAVSLAGPSARITHEKIPTLGGDVVKTAKAISQKLGYGLETLKQAAS